MEEKYKLYDLINLVELLRSKEGCPWIKTQDYISTKQYLMEEMYEVLEAVDLNDNKKLCEELGDVLFEILLYCQFAKEDQAFNFDHVVQCICEKIKTRYTHIFGDEKASDPEEVEKKWNANKNKRRGILNPAKDLSSVPKELPALLRASKVQKKMLRYVDYKVDSKEEINSVIDKIKDLNTNSKNLDRDELEKEIGEIYFNMVKLSSSLNIEGEFALTGCINKFINSNNYELGEYKNE